MENTEKVIDKLLNLTAKDKNIWWSFASFPKDNTLPYFGYQHLVMNESYGYNFESGYFFLTTFKAMDFEANQSIVELVLGFRKDFGDFEVISENQQKLFELKSLIEYEEPVKDPSISEILDSFLKGKD